MKKHLVWLLMLCSVFLCGCSSGGSSRELEHLLVVQAMGMDQTEGVLTVSLASPAESSRELPPRRLQGQGSTVTEALGELRRGSSEKELFLPSVAVMLLGEELTEEDLSLPLDYLCRSPELRMDIPVFTVRGATAASLIKDTGDERRGIVELLQNRDSLSQDGESSPDLSAAELQRRLEAYGGALLPALRRREAADGEAVAVEAAGLAVIRDGRAVAYLEEEDAPVARLLLGRRPVWTETVENEWGTRVTLEFSSPTLRVEPRQTAEGELTGFDISVSLTAALLDTRSQGDPGGEELDALRETAERLILQRMSRILRLSRDSGTDFLGLSYYIIGKGSGNGDFLTDRLSFRLAVNSKLRETRDVREDRP